jgi:hypothetical protein
LSGKIVLGAQNHYSVSNNSASKTDFPLFDMLMSQNHTPHGIPLQASESLPVKAI